MIGEYWAFLSYSHQDEKLVAQLHRSLEVLSLPRIDDLPKNLFPIFRDKDELPTSADLGDELHRALNESDYLIVFCTKNSKKSKWVNEEVKYFVEQGKAGKIIAILNGGYLNSINELLTPALLDLKNEGKLVNIFDYEKLKISKIVIYIASVLVCKEKNILLKDQRIRFIKRTVTRLSIPTAIILFFILLPTLVFFINREFYIEILQLTKPKLNQEQAKTLVLETIEGINNSYINQSILQADLVLDKAMLYGESSITIGEVTVALSYINGIRDDDLSTVNSEIRNIIIEKRDKLVRIKKTLINTYN